MDEARHSQPDLQGSLRPQYSLSYCIGCPAPVLSPLAPACALHVCQMDSARCSVPRRQFSQILPTHEKIRAVSQSHLIHIRLPAPLLPPVHAVVSPLQHRLSPPPPVSTETLRQSVAPHPSSKPDSEWPHAAPVTNRPHGVRLPDWQCGCELEAPPTRHTSRRRRSRLSRPVRRLGPVR